MATCGFPPWFPSFHCSIDGNLNAQKLSNRSRLVSHFNYVSSRDQEDLAASKAMNRPVNQDHGGNLSRMISPIATARKPPNAHKFSSMTLQTNHEFKLFAVVMHSGVSLNSGHYTAFINYSLVSQRDNSKYLSGKAPLESNAAGFQYLLTHLHQLTS